MKGPAQRYARGDATRTRIIETALEVFGTNGFEDASTRLIARRAGVNLAALHYFSTASRACIAPVPSISRNWARPGWRHFSP